MWAREAVQGLEPGSPAEAGAGRDRQLDRDLTLSWVRDYEWAVCKGKKEIPVKVMDMPELNSLGAMRKFSLQDRQVLVSIDRHYCDRRSRGSPR